MIPVRPSVAITGATGFIGSNLVRCFSQLGWPVKALVRPASFDRICNIRGISWIRGKLEDIDSLSRLLKHTDFVIHCAGAVRGETWRDFEKANVLGTANLLQACVTTGMKKGIIFISSLAAREPSLSFYALSKKDAEQLFKHSRHDIPFTILRPPAVYGPGDREIRPLFRMMQKGICPVIGDGKGRFSMLHVHDLARAVRMIIEQESFAGKIYELHDGHDGGYSWNDLISIMSELWGTSIVAIKIPVPIVKIAGLVNIGFSGLAGRKPMLTPGKVRELLHPDWIANNSAIINDIGWRPEINIERGVRQLLDSG